jgi:hypothetical protein
MSIQEARRKHFQLPFTFQEYYFTEIIGEGSYSIVYKANKGMEIVAIKQIPINLLKNQADFENLQSELDSSLILNTKILFDSLIFSVMKNIIIL